MVIFSSISNHKEWRDGNELSIYYGDLIPSRWIDKTGKLSRRRRRRPFVSSSHHLMIENKWQVRSVRCMCLFTRDKRTTLGNCLRSWEIREKNIFENNKKLGHNRKLWEKVFYQHSSLTFLIVNFPFVLCCVLLRRDWVPRLENETPAPHARARAPFWLFTFVPAISEGERMKTALSSTSGLHQNGLQDYLPSMAATFKPTIKNSPNWEILNDTTVACTIKTSSTVSIGSICGHCWLGVESHRLDDDKRRMSSSPFLESCGTNDDIL